MDTLIGAVNDAAWDLMRDHNKVWILGFYSFEGTRDVYSAELLAVIYAARWLSVLLFVSMCEIYCLDVENGLSYNDSLHLHLCAAYLVEAQVLVQKEWDVTFQHVFKEFNRPADALVKMGLRERDEFKTWNSSL